MSRLLERINRTMVMKKMMDKPIIISFTRASRIAMQVMSSENSRDLTDEDV